jgi:hypothetical protein
MYTYRLDHDGIENICKSLVFLRVRQIHAIVIIQRSQVEFDLDVVTAQFDNPSIPVFLALHAGGLYVLIAQMGEDLPDRLITSGKLGDNRPSRQIRHQPRQQQRSYAVRRRGRS